MPVTKTAKRALRSSARKQKVNALQISNLEAAIRSATKNPGKSTIEKASSLADRAAKRNLIHKNKASRIKSQLSKLTKKASKSKK